MVNPYSAPATPGESPPSAHGGPPSVWSWYLAYAILMALLNLLMFLAGAGLLVWGDQLSPYARPTEDTFAGLWIMAVVGLPLFVGSAAAPLLPKAPWAWIYHLVLICVGLTSACCLPVSLPLLIHWLKPNTKAFFGRAP